MERNPNGGINDFKRRTAPFDSLWSPDPDLSEIFELSGGTLSDLDRTCWSRSGCIQVSSVLGGFHHVVRSPGVSQVSGSKSAACRNSITASAHTGCRSVDCKSGRGAERIRV